MPRSRKKNPKPYDEDSPAAVVAGLMSLTWNKIQPLAISNLISDRLIVLHVVIFFVISGASVTRLWLMGDTVFSLGGMLILLFSFVIAFIVSFLYIHVAELLVNLNKEKIGALRISAAIILVGVPLAAGGLFLNMPILTHLSLGIIAIHMMFLLVSNLIEFQTIPDEIQNPTKLKISITLGNPLTYIALISFALTVITFISAIIRNELF